MQSIGNCKQKNGMKGLGRYIQVQGRFRTTYIVNDQITKNEMLELLSPYAF